MLERAGDCSPLADAASSPGQGSSPIILKSNLATSWTGNCRHQAAALLPHDEGIEGGYLVLRFKSFLGTVLMGDGGPRNKADNARSQSSKSETRVEARRACRRWRPI